MLGAIFIINRSHGEPCKVAAEAVDFILSLRGLIAVHTGFRRLKKITNNSPPNSTIVHPPKRIND